MRAREMCNWIDCDVTFSENASVGEASSKCSSSTNGKGSIDTVRPVVRGQVCSKCKLVRYCSAEHQRKDWEEHRRLCVKPVQTENNDV